MTGGRRSPTTAGQLHEELQALIREAHDNDIDVIGGWECRNGPEYPDWDILVTEVTKRSGSD